jgi:hypothetical protein
MLSHKIIVHKEVIKSYLPVNSPPYVRPKPTNKSFITSQEILDMFLTRQPKTGDWIYRSLATDGTTTLDLDSKSIITKVLHVVTKFEDLTFDWQTGFPETHKLITLFRGPINPWIRMENITKFSLVPEDKQKLWIDAELQNNFETAAKTG